MNGQFDISGNPVGGTLVKMAIPLEQHDIIKQ